MLLGQYPFGEPPNYDEAKIVCREEAAKGDPIAQYQTAEFERNTDPQEQNKWLELSAAQDYPPAASALGLHYFSGIGVSKDRTKAAQLFIVGASGGDTLSQGMLGGMYADGIGVPPDAVQALRWREVAASHRTAFDPIDRVREKKRYNQLAATMTPEQIAEAHRLATVH